MFRVQSVPAKIVLSARLCHVTTPPGPTQRGRTLMYVYYRISVERHWGRVLILIIDFCSLFWLTITSGHVVCSKHVTKFSTPEKKYREKKAIKR